MKIWRNRVKSEATHREMSTVVVVVCNSHGLSSSVGATKPNKLSIPIPSSCRCLRSEKWMANLPLFTSQRPASSFRALLLCHSTPRRRPAVVSTTSDGNSKAVQAALWVLEGVYILWLFLLPYAPGDPVWAISAETVNSLIALSLNFFFILPFLNSVGINVIEAPVLHPMAEGLFNFVIGWTFMFAPLLFTDIRRNRYPWSLDVLWGFQMFLTNTFLIPYMAIRMHEGDAEAAPTNKGSQLGIVMTKGAAIVGLVGAAVCLESVLWGVFGRGDDGDFGSITDRWEFLLSYLGSERLAYAFIWDICLYMVFQPWLVGDNLQNVEDSKVDVVKYLRFIPVLGLLAYLLFLDDPHKEDKLQP